ncbi:uncharacterized protein LOC126844991 isoform X2 [Adelges cooleyi]|uniref:uncharacterized protein LOC126844991 isoform X2 n=1 Tax=Adelges cooleyi TaxID=133065 RepID=UPI00217FFF85|nr:uncharacterized protein LOC126844991 isoform X2 [Adelges cooleyi]
MYIFTGYLKKEKNEVAAECFLRTSPLLKECYQMFLAKRNFNNKVNGFSLDDIFDYFGIICSMIDGKISADYESKTVIEKLQYILDTSHVNQSTRVDKCVETDRETNDKCVQEQFNCKNDSPSLLQESLLVINVVTRPSAVEQSPISSFEKSTNDKFSIAHSTPCSFSKTKLNDITNIVPNITSEFEENLNVCPQKIGSPSKRIEETKNCPSPKSHQIHPTNSFQGLGESLNTSLLDKPEIHQIPEATPLEAMPGLLKEDNTLTSSVNNTYQGKRKLFRKKADTMNKSVEAEKKTDLSVTAQNTQNLNSSLLENTFDSTECNPQINNLLDEFLIFNSNTVNGNKDVELNCIKSRLRNSKKKYGSMKINKKKSCIRTKNIKSCKKIDSNIILINESHDKQSSFENCEGNVNQGTIKSNLSTSFTHLFNCSTSSAVSAMDSDENHDKSDFGKIIPNIKPMDLGPQLSQSTENIILSKSMENMLEDNACLKNQMQNLTDVDVQPSHSAEISKLISLEQTTNNVIGNITFSHVSKEALVVNEINSHDTPDAIQKPPKTKSMSTPRRRSTHIRTLDFSTPQPKKNAIEQARSKLFCDSPKRILSILEESLTSPMPKLEGNWGAVNGFESIAKKDTVIDGKPCVSNTVGSEIVTLDTRGRETKKSSRKGRTPKKNVKCVQNIDVVCNVTNENVIEFGGSDKIDGKDGDEPSKLNMCLNEKNNLNEPIDVCSRLIDHQMQDDLAATSENNTRLTNTRNLYPNQVEQEEFLEQINIIPAGNQNKSLNDLNTSTEVNHKSSKDLVAVQSNLLLNNTKENNLTIKNDENQLFNGTNIISDIIITDTENQETEKSIFNRSKTPEQLDNSTDNCCSTTINKSIEKIPQQDDNIMDIHTFNVPNEVEKIDKQANDSHLLGTTNKFEKSKNDDKTIISDTQIYLPSLSTVTVSKNNQNEQKVKLQNNSFNDVAEINSSVNSSNISLIKHHNVAKTPYKYDESTVIPETPISKMLREYDPSKLVTPIPATPVHNEDSLMETPLTKVFRETSYLNRPPISPFPPTPGNSQSVDIVKSSEQQQVTEKSINKLVETASVNDVVDKPKEVVTQILPPMKTTNNVIKTPPTAKKKKSSPLKIKFKHTPPPPQSKNNDKSKKLIVNKTQIYESVKVELFGNNSLTSSSDDDDEKPRNQPKSLIIKKKPTEDERTSGFKPIPRRKSIQDTVVVNDAKRSSSAEQGLEQCASLTEQIERNKKNTKKSSLLDNHKPSAVHCGKPELIETEKCMDVPNKPYVCNPIEKKIKSSKLNNSCGHTRSSREQAKNKLVKSSDSSKSTAVNKSKNTDIHSKKATNTPSCCYFNQSDSKQDSEDEMNSSRNVPDLRLNSSKTFTNLSLNKSNPSESSSMSFTSSVNNTLPNSYIQGRSETVKMNKIDNERFNIEEHFEKPMVYEIITEDDEREMVHLCLSPILALFDLPSEITSKLVNSNSPLTLSSKKPVVKTSELEVGELVDDDNTFVSTSFPPKDIIDRKNNARRSPSFWEDSVHKHKSDRGKESNHWRKTTRKDDRYDAKIRYRSNNYRNERMPSDKKKYQDNYNTPSSYKREDRHRGQERYKICEEDRKRNYYDSHNSHGYKSRKRFEESERRVSSSQRMFQNSSQHFGGEDFVKKATKRSSDRFDYSQIPPKMYKSDQKRY